MTKPFVVVENGTDGVARSEACDLCNVRENASGFVRVLVQICLRVGQERREPLVEASDGGTKRLGRDIEGLPLHVPVVVDHHLNAFTGVTYAAGGQQREIDILTGLNVVTSDFSYSRDSILRVVIQLS